MKLKENSRAMLHRGYSSIPDVHLDAPSIFQKVMDTVLQGLPMTICQLDDILISKATKEVHLQI